MTRRLLALGVAILLGALAGAYVIALAQWLELRGDHAPAGLLFGVGYATVVCGWIGAVGRVFEENNHDQT